MADPISDLREAGKLIERAVYELRADHDVPWYHTARGEIGVREIPGADHHPRILEYLSTCHRDAGGNLGDWGAERDETPWCSAFVNWVLLRQELAVTRHALARSWLSWGRETEPRRGAIVVLSRPGGGGHVGFLESLEEGQVRLVGGNQRNAVSAAPYPMSRVLSYRWPTDY